MPYRRTERVVRRLAEREQSILDAATALAAEGGMAAVQVAAVATRAGIAAGTVYRYFPSKTDLIAELVAAVAGRELNAMKAAADAAPGPLSALAAAIAAFAARALNERRLAWAVIGEAVDADVDAMRLDFRQSLAARI
jgi:AcrR family transcriptional regulator